MASKRRLALSKAKKEMNSSFRHMAEKRSTAARNTVTVVRQRGWKEGVDLTHHPVGNGELGLRLQITRLVHLVDHKTRNKHTNALQNSLFAQLSLPPPSCTPPP
jgi:hypothetical protein